MHYPTSLKVYPKAQKLQEKSDMPIAGEGLIA